MHKEFHLIRLSKEWRPVTSLPKLPFPYVVKKKKELILAPRENFRLGMLIGVVWAKILFSSVTFTHSQEANDN